LPAPWAQAKPRLTVRDRSWQPDQTLYVGDRLDNDIVPAAAAGLRTALIKRGPWAMIWQDDPAAKRVPTLRIDSLAELPGKIAAFNAGVC
jgi:FMN phosphatase YigB (HAD superfamily)